MNRAQSACVAFRAAKSFQHAQATQLPVSFIISCEALGPGQPDVGVICDKLLILKKCSLGAGTIFPLLTATKRDQHAWNYVSSEKQSFQGLGCIQYVRYHQTSEYSDDMHRILNSRFVTHSASSRVSQF